MSVAWQDTEGLSHEACTLCFAAQEIANALRQVPGTRALPGAWQGESPSAPFVLLLSKFSLAIHQDAVERFFGRQSLPEAPQSFAISTVQRVDGTAYLVLGADRAGALYGAYELLNRLGFRWFSPDAWDSEIPEALPDPLPQLHLRQKPSFERRGFMGGGEGGREFVLWMARNKMNGWRVGRNLEPFCRKLGILFDGGPGHGVFERYLPPARHYDKHPEWYGLRNGKRSSKVEGGAGDNACFANAEMRKEVSRGLVEDLIDGSSRWADMVEIWATDNGRWCECEPCARLGNHMDKLLLLAHDCRQAIRRAMEDGRLCRNVKVSVLAYHETLPPPTRPLPEDFDHNNVLVTFFPIMRCYAHGLNDLLCTEINARFMEMWEAWTAKPTPFRGSMVIGEYYNVSTFSGISIPFTRVMANDLPFYHRTGACQIHYMHPLSQQWGTLALTNCQFAAQIWDHALNPSSWLDRFLHQRYGAQARDMKIFYERLEPAMRNCKPLRHYVLKAAPENESLPSDDEYVPGYRITGLNDTLRREGRLESPNPIFTTRHLCYDSSESGQDEGPSLVETMTLLEQAQQALDRAMLDCRQPSICPRLVSDALRFRYTKQMLLFVYYLVRLRMQENKGTLELAQAEARALREIGETLRGEDLMNRFNFFDAKYDFYRNGLTSTWLDKTYEEVMKKYFPSKGG
jgi:hypothetical protein